MKERSLETWLRTEVRRRGGRCLKLTFITGIPDRLVCFPGKPPIFIELKAPGKKPSPQQEVVIKQLRAEGHEVYVADSKEQILFILNNLI